MPRPAVTRAILRAVVGVSMMLLMCVGAAGHPTADAVHATISGASRMIATNLKLKTVHKHARLALSSATTLRGFGAAATSSAATPAPTCDPTALANAEITIDQECSSIAGLDSGNVSVYDFLSTFCGSTCYTVLDANLAVLDACLGSSASTLAEFISGCQTAPQCYDSAPLSAALAIEAGCLPLVPTLVDFYNNTQAANDAIGTFCGTCLSQVVSFFSTYPECSATETNGMNPAAVSAALQALCATTGPSSGGTQQYCAWNLRSIGNVDCSGNPASPWCSGGTLALTEADLGTMCGNGCLSGLAAVAHGIGLQARLVEGVKELFCTTTSSGGYCYLTGSAAAASLNTSLYTGLTQAAMNTTCSAASGYCLNAYFALSSALAVTVANEAFTTCAASVSSAASIYTDCVTSLQSSLSSAATIRALGELSCSQDASGTYCVTLATNFVSSCFSGAGTSASCPAGCSATLTGVISATGCCLRAWNSYLRHTNANYPASYLPPGSLTATIAGGATATYTFNPLYAVASQDRSQQPMNALAYCSNTSALWVNVEQQCPAPSYAVPGHLRLYVSYAALNADPALMGQFMAGLVSDVALAARVPSSYILNGSLAEDASISVTVASRRASSTAGTQFTFAVSGPSAAAAQTAAATFNGAVTNGTFATVNAAAAISSCVGCTAPTQSAATLSEPSSTPSPAFAPAIDTLLLVVVIVTAWVGLY